MGFEPILFFLNPSDMGLSPSFILCYNDAMKKLICILILALLLTGAASAATCGEVITTDGGLCRESALGNLAADAMRAYTGADAALFPVGDMGINLLPGEITEQAIADSFPNDRAIVLVTLPEAEFRALLEQGLSKITLAETETIDEAASANPDFFCISGFTLEYDASAPVGSRLYTLEVTDPITVALPAGYLDGEEVGTVREAVQAYCEAQGTVTAPACDRIKALGAYENTIIGGLIPKSLVIVAVVIVFLFSGQKYRRVARERTER